MLLTKIMKDMIAQHQYMNNYLSPNKAFSSIDLVGQCLLDTNRTNAFKKAIDANVTKDSIVVDVGTGSGVLAMLASKAGARHVYAIELDPFIADIAQNNFSVNKMTDKITLVRADARTFDFNSLESFDKKIDVVLMELITTGMIDEFQVPAINNLNNQGCLSSNVAYIPFQQNTYATLINYNFDFYGLKFPMIIHSWDIHKSPEVKIEKLSDTKLIDSFNFINDSRNSFDKQITLESNQNKTANAILLESESCLDKDNSLWETSALNGKVVVPIPEIAVQDKTPVNIRINYNYGGGFESFNLQII